MSAFCSKAAAEVALEEQVPGAQEGLSERSTPGTCPRGNQELPSGQQLTEPQSQGCVSSSSRAGRIHWVKAVKLLTGAQAAGEQRDSSETHSMCNSHLPDEPFSPSNSCVWANKVCRNLSQRRLTISQGKQHLNILAGLVKVVPALPVGFPSLFY